jgi:hypothetical protein
MSLGAKSSDSFYELRKSHPGSHFHSTVRLPDLRHGAAGEILKNQGGCARITFAAVRARHFYEFNLK